MVILVVSDSHGRFASLSKAMEQVRPGMVIHLGDGAAEASRLAVQYPTVQVVQVAGNCDFLSELPLTRRIEVDGVGLYLCHGHTHNVKQSLLNATYAAREQHAQVLLFGHTHQPLHDNLGDLLLLNPGSIGYDGRYATMEIKDGAVSCNLRSL